MSKYDAERAFKIYKTFSKQTDQVVQFLSVARQYENATRLEIPKLKHAPTSLTSSLEEYLNDPDFEINKRQYLAQQEAKKGGKSVPKTPAKVTSGAQKPMASKDFPEPTPIVAPQRQEPKGPAPDLIDFFDSIEQKQQPMAIQPQQTPSSQTGQQYLQQPQSSTFFSSGQGPYPQDGLSQQPQQQQQTANFIGSNPYSQVQNVVHQPVQLDFSGAGVSGYPQQQQFGQPQNQSIPNAIQQNSTPQGLLPQQQQPFNTGQLSQPSSNPFRQVSMPTGSSTSTFTPSSAVIPVKARARILPRLNHNQLRKLFLSNLHNPSHSQIPNLSNNSHLNQCNRNQQAPIRSRATYHLQPLRPPHLLHLCYLTSPEALIPSAKAR
ncbi:MAG: hypothetical protein Q9224_000942 [Gallowayella concinna]